MVLVKRLELLAARMEIEGYHERFEKIVQYLIK